jgi:hypothetical protein
LNQFENFKNFIALRFASEFISKRRAIAAEMLPFINLFSDMFFRNTDNKVQFQKNIFVEK